MTLKRSLRNGAVIVALAAANAAAAVDLTGISIEEAADGATVTLALSSAVSAPTTFALDAPQRLVVDLPEGKTPNRAVAGAGGVRVARAAQFSAAAARIVIDLDKPMVVKSAVAGAGTLVLTLRPADEGAFKAEVQRRRVKLLGAAVATASAPSPAKPIPLSGFTLPPAPAAAAPKLPLPKAEVVATKPDPATLKVETAAVKPVAPPPPPSKVSAVVTKQAEAAAQAATTPQVRAIGARIRAAYRPLVVIDPGHGGHDAGAISVLDGRKEKDAVLAIALRLRKELEGAGYRVLMTRSDDRFIPLPERVRIAQTAKGSLFISIHADSAPGTEARGASIYTLSEVASDREAARLAAKENMAGVLQGVNLQAASRDVADILLDLAQRETMNVSAEFATTMQREMQDEVPFKTNGHRFAGFVVLKAADIPSVLFETGYLSSMDDARRLFSDDGQRTLAKGIRQAVDAHFQRRLASR